MQIKQQPPEQPQLPQEKHHLSITMYKMLCHLSEAQQDHCIATRIILFTIAYVREHLSRPQPSVFRHLHQCKTKTYKPKY